MLITKNNQSDESVTVLTGALCSKAVNNLLFLVKMLHADILGTNLYKFGHHSGDNPCIIPNLIEAE